MGALTGTLALLVLHCWLWIKQKFGLARPSKIPEPNWGLHVLLDCAFGSNKLEKFEFLTEFYQNCGLFRYGDRIVIFDTKLAQTAINKLEKGADNFLENSPLKETFLGSSSRNPEVRRAIATIFRKNIIEDKSHILLDDIDNFIRKLTKNLSNPVNMTSWSLKFAMDVVGHSLLQLDLKALEGQQNKLIEAMMTILHECYALHNITVTSDKFVEASENLDKLTAKILQDALQSEDKDIVGKRLVEELNDVCGFEWAKDNMKLFLMAGSETTAATIPVVCYLLATFPHYQLELQREADENIERLRRDPVHTLPKLESMIKEVLRLYPIAPFITRHTHQATTLGTYTLEPKSDILIFTWGIHRSAQLWTESRNFSPFRFLDSSSPEQSNMFIPFGGGTRVCIGQHLAWLELKLVLSNLLNKFTFETVPETPELNFVVDWEHAVVHPDKDMFFKLRTR